MLLDITLYNYQKIESTKTVITSFMYIHIFGL